MKMSFSKESQENLSQQQPFSSFSLDCGDEFGITLCRQPPLPPPNPPGTYSPNQMRRWWVKKDDVANMKLNVALLKMKSLYNSTNTFELFYFDGFSMMPIVNDKDLQSSMRYFLANSSNPDVSRIYLEEQVTKDHEEFKAVIRVNKKIALATEKLKVSELDKSHPRKYNKKSDDKRLQAFRNRVLAKHGEKTEVINKTTIKCLYDSCKKNVLCKEYNMQNFDKHVDSCHSAKQRFGPDIRMLLTMIGQNNNSQSADTISVNSNDDDLDSTCDENQL